MDIAEACLDRLTGLINEVRGCLEQLPEGPEREQIANYLAQMERIAEERLGPGKSSEL